MNAVGAEVGPEVCLDSGRPRMDAVPEVVGDHIAVCRVAASHQEATRKSFADRRRRAVPRNEYPVAPVGYGRRAGGVGPDQVALNGEDRIAPPRESNPMGCAPRDDVAGRRAGRRGRTSDGHDIGVRVDIDRVGQRDRSRRVHSDEVALDGDAAAPDSRSAVARYDVALRRQRTANGGAEGPDAHASGTAAGDGARRDRC